MVDDADVEKSGSLLYSPGDVVVLHARLERPRRMVVKEHHRGGVHHQRLAYNAARVDGGSGKASPPCAGGFDRREVVATMRLKGFDMLSSMIGMIED